MIPLATVLPLFRDAGRPVIAGEVESAVLGRFRVHFAREGADAPSPVDGDHNGLPDAVDAIGAALGAAAEAYEAEGWRPLADDAGVDGPELDVYVRGLDAFGYATPSPSSDGTASCYLQLDPDNPLPGRVAESVAWHELHHCVQFRYDADAASFLYEMTSTLQQYGQVHDPVLDYGSGLLWYEWLTGPGKLLASTEGRREYAAFVFAKFWTERGGGGPDMGRLQRLWDRLAVDALAGEEPEDGPAWVGSLDRAAREEWEDGLDAAYLDHVAWNLFACAADDGAHYAAEGAGCTAIVAVETPPYEDGELVESPLGPFTGAYRRLDEGSGLLRAVCEGLGSARLVARDAGGALADAADGPDAQVDVPEGGDAVLVLAGTAAGPLSLTCRLAEPVPEPIGDQRVRGTPTGGCDSGGGLGLPGALGGLALVARRRRSPG